MTNSDKAAALHCSLSLGSLDALMQLEKPKSARYNRLRTAMDAVNRCVDLYRLEAFSTADMDNASKVIDSANEMIREMYP
jgi:hypothetical protein